MTMPLNSSFQHLLRLGRLALRATAVAWPLLTLGTGASAQSARNVGGDYIVTAPADGVYSFQPTFTNSFTSATDTQMRVNGAIVGPNYSIPIAPTTTPAARPITLTKGINVITFEQGTMWLGWAAQVVSLSFTAP